MGREAEPTDLVPVSRTRAALRAARRAWLDWRALSVKARLAVIKRARHTIADRVEHLACTVQAPWRTRPAETVSAEIMPLAEACRFLEREAKVLLGDTRLGQRRRPLWLGGSDVRIAREPWGVVLIIGPSNYPLMLPGIQALQALAAGNAVLLKPGRTGKRAALAFHDVLVDAGLPRDVLAILDEDPAAARAAIRDGVDKVILTGSVATGREIQRQLAPRLVPSVLELSGCDPVFVRDDADIDLAARALRFGMTFNGGFTCIAPRRVYVHCESVARLESSLATLLAGAPPINVAPESVSRVAELTTDAMNRGATWLIGRPPSGFSMHPSVLSNVDPDAKILSADLAAPLISLVPVESDHQALDFARRCDYALGATVFGASEEATRHLARSVNAGVVTINDMIVPTADPRIAFGGRGDSGFGVTRGAEGLLEMTRTKTVIRRRGRLRPHFDPIGPAEERMLPAFVRLAHASSFGRRFRALIQIIQSVSRKTGKRAHHADA